MEYYIGTENSSGMEFKDKVDFLKEISLMIDDCKANGGTKFDIQVFSDASCFYCEHDKNDLQDVENCEYRDTTKTSYDEYYEREMYYCEQCKCYMAKEECLTDCPLR